MPDQQGNAHGMDTGVPAAVMPNWDEAELVEKVRRIPSRECRAVLLAIIDQIGGGTPGPGPTP